MSCTNNTNYCKSCERFYNNTPQALPVTTTTVLNLGTNVVNTGVSIETTSTTYNVVKKGLYHLTGDVVINATATGTATFYITMDGTQLPCTVKTVTLAAGDTSVHTETDLVLNTCCCVDHSFAFVVTTGGTATGTVDNFCSGVLKLA